MTAAGVARSTLTVCLISAAVETVLACTSTASLAPSDVLIVLFIVGPYLLLTLLAWGSRHQQFAGWVLLAVAASISAFGLFIFGWDSYRYHTEPEYRLVQRMAAFAVPVLQWPVVLATGLVLFAVRR